MAFDPTQLSGANIAIIAAALFFLVMVLLGVRIVPQSNAYVITRLGKYLRTLPAGVNIIVPLLDQVFRRVSIADQVFSDVALDVVSRDNVVFKIELLVVYRIERPEYAVFRVNNVADLVLGLVKSLVRSEMGKVELDTVQQDRESLNKAIQVAIADAASDYGIIVSRAEIVDVQLNTETQRAMAEVLEAERARRATITRAEGDRRAVELAADAALYEARQTAEAKRVQADATAYANGVIGAAIRENGEAAAGFQIAERQIEAVRTLSESPNAKLILIPGDVSDGFTRAAAILTDTLPSGTATARPLTTGVPRTGGGE